MWMVGGVLHQAARNIVQLDASVNPRSGCRQASSASRRQLLWRWYFFQAWHQARARIPKGPMVTINAQTAMWTLKTHSECYTAKWVDITTGIWLERCIGIQKLRGTIANCSRLGTRTLKIWVALIREHRRQTKVCENSPFLIVQEYVVLGEMGWDTEQRLRNVPVLQELSHRGPPRHHALHQQPIRMSKPLYLSHIRTHNNEDQM